jgi:cyclomaltodextrinase / maltogenic alpha-amylase / neopullulanase
MRFLSAGLTKLFLLIIGMALLGSSCQSEKKSETATLTEPPSWAAEVVWYQIFVERFRNGDSTNDPSAPEIEIPALKVKAPEGWKVTPWGQDWYARDGWYDTSRRFNGNLQHRRYGGDLRGVLDKLDYLQDLGITAIYLNPINDAPSMHKYDASSYHHVDANFGPDPAGDRKIMAAETPGDPTTWKWTAADKLFLQLVDEVHKRGMKIILDFSWNHTGTKFWAFEDVIKNGEKSAFKDWYNIKTFDNPATPENEFEWEGWLNAKSLPEIKKVNLTTERKIGYPYEGDINAGAKAHIFEVTKRWLAPDGDVKKGIDGYRLDVADHVGLVFWRDWRKQVRSINPDALLVGEIWWAQWPDVLMDPAPYTKGDIFDAVMFYQAYRPAKYFFSESNFAIDAKQLKDSLDFEWNRLLKPNKYAMMNVSSTHDAPRLLSCFGNPGKYKYKASPYEDTTYLSGRPSEETYQRLRLYLVHLFTSVGAPQIWNGEEMGMWGGDDPEPRKPLWWKEIAFDDEATTNIKSGAKQFEKVGFNQQQFDWYKKLIALRKANPVLMHGDMEFFLTEGQRLGYKRSDGKDEILVLFNLEGTECTFELPAEGKYTNLLNGEKTEGKKVKVKGLDAVVLKKNY